MKKAKIYKPSKTAMQSGTKKFEKWVIEFITKEDAINYAKKKKIDYEIIEPKKRKIVKKSYADNFLN